MDPHLKFLLVVITSLLPMSIRVILSEFSTYAVSYSNMINSKNNKPLSHQYIMTQVGLSSLKPSFDTENNPSWLIDLAEQRLAHNPNQKPFIFSHMTPIDVNLANTRGLVIHKQFQAAEVAAEVLGLPYQTQTKYRIHHLPPQVKARTHPHDQEGWCPTTEEIKNLDRFLFAQEESSCLSRVCLTYLGCRNLRPLKLHLMVDGASGDVFVADRRFRLGGFYCCPLIMDLSSVHGNELIRLGRVRENFDSYLNKCCQICCYCTTYTDVERLLPDNTFSKRYTIRMNMACCGRTNNCCGGSCFKRNAVYDILDTNGEIVAHLQLTAGDMQAWCRAAGMFRTFILEFPVEATAEDRALLLAALFQINFECFALFQNDINLVAKCVSLSSAIAYSSEEFNQNTLLRRWCRPTDLECVVEYMNRGDLRTIIERMSKEEFTWEQKFASVISIARGVILSELTTHQVPYASLINPKNNLPLSHQYKMTQVGYHHLKPALDMKNTPGCVIDLAEQCLSHEPDERSTMIQINLMLSRLEMKFTDYM
ncbi:scramblase [Thraustotheca clavata]|uniref:Scramblase n=1 Tax=Thraustotheca clavata TaxID=74557 RepID=A0A1W0A978_9STRA|nr:scramblase [Thraustotheca clavata]